MSRRARAAIRAHRALAVITHPTYDDHAINDNGVCRCRNLGTHTSGTPGCELE